jgi:hypothetical protein
MLAYTAWDGLQTIARQYDADLEIVSGNHIALVPRRTRSAPATAIRRLAERLRAGSPGSRTVASARRGDPRR